MPPYAPLSDFISSEWKKPQIANKVAIIDGTTNQSRTFAEYHSTMCSLAASLSDLGVLTTSKVGLFCPNNVDYVPISLAVTMTGAKLVPINPLYKANELETVLKTSKTEVLFTQSALLDTALEAVKNLKSVRHIIVIPEAGQEEMTCPEGTISFGSLKLKRHEKPWTESNKSIKTAKHFAVLPFSSGTSGLPKGVCLSHENIISNLYQLEEVEGMASPCDHKLISPLPFFHIYGFSVSAMWCAWRGQQLITMSKFDFETFCKLVETHKPQRAYLVPPIVLALAKSPIVDKYDLSSLNNITCGAAPLSSDAEIAVTDRLGIKVKQGWGMSELSPLGLLNSDYNMKAGSAGPLVSNTFGKILDIDTGKSLGPNNSGELLIKGPQVMLGYLNNPSATMECLDSYTGWMKTGDLAHYDSDGFFYLTDRIKELIKVKGMQVAPAELEALLLTHEAVQDVVVTCIPSEEFGQLPKASIVLKADAVEDATEKDIQEWVKERVAPHKQLGGGVVFIDAVPKSASGKILRRLVK